MTACTDCNKDYEAYLSDLPSAWRSQIAELMCRVVRDVDKVTCEEVKACETLTTLSPFTLDEDELCITYTDERGVSIQRCIEIPNFGGDFINNQFDAQQIAEFWISGRSRVGNIDVTSDTLPANGLNLAAANVLGLISNGAIITTIAGTSGLMTHSGNIFLDATISSQPGISFFLNTLTNNDYFLQRRGTTIDLHGAGISMMSANVNTLWTVNSNPNRGFEMSDSGFNLLQMFPDGTLHIERTNVQQVPDTGAIVKIVSTTRAVVFPNMTTAQKMAIAPPSPGGVVFDTDLQKLCVYTNAWETITSV